jgi:hypothetical protein
MKKRTYYQEETQIAAMEQLAAKTPRVTEAEHVLRAIDAYLARLARKRT